MSVTQLETFIAIAEERHLGRAARRLHVTQAPLSRRLASLEDELGAALFERTSRGMRLLPAGARLLPYARRILETIEAAATAVHASSNGDPSPHH